MPTTMDLLDDALRLAPMPVWTQRLKLARNTLSTAKNRQHLSPAIAGALAEELQQDAQKWIVVAALESERDSACKTRMLKRVGQAMKKPGITGFVMASALFAVFSLPTVERMVIAFYDSPLC